MADVTLSCGAVPSFASLSMDRSAALTANISVSSNTATTNTTVGNIADSNSLTIITMDNSDVVYLTLSSTLGYVLFAVISKTLDTWQFLNEFASLGKPIVFHDRTDELPAVFYERDSKEVIFHSGEYGLDKKAHFRLPVYSNVNRKKNTYDQQINAEDAFETISMDQSDNPTLSVGITFSSTVA